MASRTAWSTSDPGVPAPAWSHRTRASTHGGIRRVHAAPPGQCWCPWASVRRTMLLEQPEVPSSRASAFVEGRRSTGPHAAQFAEEQTDGDRAPTGQGVELGRELRVAPVAPTDLSDVVPEALVHGVRQFLQAGGGAEVVAGVAALVEQCDQSLPRHVASLGDPV